MINILKKKKQGTVNNILNDQVKDMLKVGSTGHYVDLIGILPSGILIERRVIGTHKVMYLHTNPMSLLDELKQASGSIFKSDCGPVNFELIEEDNKFRLYTSTIIKQAG